jgi:hypothetical protein
MNKPGEDRRYTVRDSNRLPPEYNALMIETTVVWAVPRGKCRGITCTVTVVWAVPGDKCWDITCTVTLF